jgi:hypothetical protein
VLIIATAPACRLQNIYSERRLGLERVGTVPRMSVPASALLDTSGYLVADAHGRLVGRVECPMYGTKPEVPDALSVRKGFARRRRLVPADAIDQIDGRSGVVGLKVARDSLRSFL